jgi:DNA-binding NtrC family response regulator
MAPVPLVTHPERILIVDDEAGMRELLLALFRKNGYQTVASADADAALALAAEVDPTVAIIDYRIAGGGGINLIAKLRDHLPDVRCIFMTAYDNPDYFASAVKAGAYDTIQKPFDILELLAQVERQIDLKKRVVRGVIRLG